MKTYIIYKPGMGSDSPAIGKAIHLTHLFNKMMEDEMISSKEEFDKLIIIEGEFIQNNPLH